MMRRARVLALACTLALPLSSCVAPVFHQPITLSTRSTMDPHVRRLTPVRATTTNSFFILLPIPSDPRDLYEDLLAEARKAGGNAVVDLQVRSSSVFAWTFPVVIFDTVEAVGTAAIIE